MTVDRKRFGFPGILAAVLVIAAAAYAPSLNNGFVYDDLSVLKDNICLGDPARLPSLFTREYFAAFSEYTYRPVCSLSYWVDAWLWKGRPAGYHVTSLLLHLATAAGLYWLALCLGGTKRTAFLAASVFALHPVFSEAVYCSAFREDILAALASVLLLAVVFSPGKQLGGKRRILLAGWLFVVGILSKEAAAALFPVLIFSVLIPCPKEHHDTRKTRLWATVLILVLTMVYSWLRFSYMRHPQDALNEFHGGGIMTNMVNAPRTYFMALGVFLLPFKLAPDHPVAFWNESHLWAAGLLMLALVAAAAAAIAWARKRFLFCFSTLAFLVTYSITANWIPIPQFFAERYCYLPGMFLCLAAAYLLDGLLTAAGNAKWKLKWVPQTAAVMLIAALFTWYVYSTRTLGSAWASEFNLWKHTLDTMPDSSLAREHLGAWWMEKGQLEKARELFTEALRRNQTNPEPLANMVSLLIQSGEYSQAATLINDGLDRFSETGIFQQKAGILSSLRGHSSLTTGWFKKAIEANPSVTRPYLFLGRHYLGYVKFQQAGDSAAEYRKRAPGDPEGVVLEAQIAEAAGDLKRAAGLYRFLTERLPENQMMQHQLERTERLQRLHLPPSERP